MPLGAAWPWEAGRQRRVPWTQCLPAVQWESSGGPRWGTTARLQGWTPSRGERKSPCLPQLLVLPLLCMSCLPAWSINWWNAGIMCYLVLILSPKCWALCWMYYGCSKTCSGQRTRNQGQREKERGKAVMAICRHLKDEGNGRAEGFSQWRQVAWIQVLLLPVPGCIILSKVPTFSHLCLPQSLAVSTNWVLACWWVKIKWAN